MKKLFNMALCLALLALGTSFDAGAMDGPHVDPAKVVNTSCTACHNSSLPSESSTFNNNCLSCHSDFYAGTNSAAKLTSHRWTGNLTTPSAGAQPPTIGALSQVQHYTGSQLACVNCHDPHTDVRTSYLRITNTADQLCLDCHRSRNVQSAAAGSHPIMIGYSSAAKAAPDKFVGKAPVNANTANPTSDLGARLSSDGKLLCSTCHDVHSADSRSSNYVNGFKNISTGDGNLLRTNPRGSAVAAGQQDYLNICTNCHAGKTNHNAKGQDIQCLDCHAAHVEYDPNDPTNAKGINVNLIRRNLPGSAKQILFRYTGDNREYKNAAGTGVCQGCHDVPNTIGDHVSTDPNVCNKCHTHDNAKGAFTASMPDHKAIMGSGDIVMFTPDSNHDITPLNISEECALCHYESLVQQHNSNCSLCHSGANPPRNSFTGPWNKTCSQGSCHPSLHTKMTANHNGIYNGSSSSCDKCHDTSGGYPGPGDFCDRCHNPGLTAAAVGDHQPPVTTSNVLSSYVGPATIHLSAADAESGVSSTWYSLDGRAWKMGSDIYVSAPSSGSKAHTIQFYSVDHAMNAEAAKSANFTVQAVIPVDTTPPATTSSFNPAANAIFNTSQSVTLAPLDSVSGVKATYYKIDAGVFLLGTSFVVSGDGLHTFSYYSIDNANNSETVHISNTFRIDTLAPVTANSAVAGANYTGAQTFALTASDSGSGVASTWYKLDAAATFTSGTSIAVPAPANGSTSHTIYWYSIDVAGNQEVTKSVTFTVQAALVVDTTPPATTSSFTPAAGVKLKANQPVALTATDSASGVKATYYKIDAGSFVQGTSFTVTGDGLHTFSYYSVDNANNIETTHVSNSFRIDTVAPVTTCSAVNGGSYTGAKTFTLAAIDGGSGVASTWYKLDGGVFTQGTSIAVAAPTSGSAAHTISWYSIDAAGNQEATTSVSFTVAASGGGTATLIGRNSSSTNHPYTHFWVNDASDVNLIADGGWSSDEHVTGATFVVPASVGYIMHVEWEYPDYESGDPGSDSRVVTSLETSPGATVSWSLNLP